MPSNPSSLPSRFGFCLFVFGRGSVLCVQHLMGSSDINSSPLNKNDGEVIEFNLKNCRMWPRRWLRQGSGGLLGSYFLCYFLF